MKPLFIVLGIMFILAGVARLVYCAVKKAKE